MDSLRVLDTDPVDYLVTPRVLACMIAGPILNVLCFCMGERRWREGRGLVCDCCRVGMTGSLGLICKEGKALYLLGGVEKVGYGLEGGQSPNS